MGDSLLNHFSEEEIILKTEFEKEQGNNKEMAVVYFSNKKNFKSYRRLKASYETKDKNYKILSLTGFVDINKNIDEFNIKKNEISEELKNLFKNLDIEDQEWKKHAFDSSSRTKSIIFYFPTKSKYFTFIRVSCYDWSTTSGYNDQLRVELVTSKYYEWLYKLYQSKN